MASKGTDDQASAARTSLESAWPPSRRQRQCDEPCPDVQAEQSERRPDHDGDQQDDRNGKPTAQVQRGFNLQRLEDSADRWRLAAPESPGSCRRSPGSSLAACVQMVKNGIFPGQIDSCVSGSWPVARRTPLREALMDSPAAIDRDSS